MLNSVLNTGLALEFLVPLSLIRVVFVWMEPVAGESRCQSHGYNCQGLYQPGSES